MSFDASPDPAAIAADSPSPDSGNGTDHPVPAPATYGITWQYVAGFFDGEGTISIGQRGIQWSIAQSHLRGREVLRRIQSFLLHEGIKSSVYIARPDDCNTLYVTDRKRVRDVISKLMPFLIVKKVECQDALRWMTIFPAMRRGSSLGMLISEARRRGKPTWGPNNSRLKLNPELVREIRECAARGVRTYVLSRVHGIHFNTLKAVITRKTWAQIP
jgi:hypothetical protein